MYIVGVSKSAKKGAGYGVCGDIVINGGQVTATGGNYAPGIGRGFAGMILFVENSGTLTLGWSNRDDFVYINKLTNPAGVLSSITFVQGKQFVLNGTETIATADNIEGKKIMPYATPVSLSNSADNSAAISAADGHFANVTLADRTLYRDGTWNTLCVPFNVTLSGSPLQGAVARPLTSASISGTTLNLTFGPAVMELMAGTPYIIKWESGDPIVSSVFSGVTIDKTDRSYDKVVIK